MLSNNLINLCLYACCGLNDNINNVFTSISNIVNKYKDTIDINNIDIDTINKIELLTKLVEYRIDNPKIDDHNIEILLSEIENGKLGKYVDTIKHYRSNISTKINDKDIDTIIKTIIDKGKVLELIDDKNKIEKLLSDIDTGNYTTDAEIIDRWSVEIIRLSRIITERRRIDNRNHIKSLDLKEDNYSSALEELKRIYLPENIVKTGFKKIDDLFPCDGLEQNRLYTFAGTSGVGKSTFLANIARNVVFDKSNIEKEKNILLITGENLVSETLLRLYCCMTGESVTNTVKSTLIKSPHEIEKKLKTIMKDYNSDIMIRYFKPNVTTASDIRNIVDDCCNKKGYITLAGLDYIDITRSSLKVQDPIVDLGLATIEYKDIALEYKHPFIQLTHLNRTGYDKTSEPSLSSMGKSMEKVNASDGVIFLQEAEDRIIKVNINGIDKTYSKSKLTMLKNRNGDIGISTFLLMNIRSNNIKVFNYSMEEVIEKQMEESEPLSAWDTTCNITL